MNWLIRKFQDNRLTLGAIVIALIICGLMWLLSNPTGGGGPVKPTDTASASSTTKATEFKERTTIRIRNEVYVVDGQEMTIEQLKSWLPKLKTAQPKAILELRTTDDEKMGMIKALETAAEQHRVSLHRTDGGDE